MRPGTEETAVTRLSIPVDKVVRPLMGLSAEAIAKNGVRIEFDLSDGKSKGELVVEPAHEAVTSFRPPNTEGVPLVGLSITLKTRSSYLITVKKPDGESYVSAGAKTDKGVFTYSNWTKIDRNTEKIDVNKNKVPSFSSLEVQAAEFTFHRASQKVIGARGWQ
jgi:hypothetical protein